MREPFKLSRSPSRLIQAASPAVPSFLGANLLVRAGVYHQQGATVSGETLIALHFLPAPPCVCHHDLGLVSARCDRLEQVPKCQLHLDASQSLRLLALRETDSSRRITLTIANSEPHGDDQDLLSLEVYPEMTIETLRSSIQAETTFHPSAQHLYHNGQLVTDNSKTLAELGVADGDMLALHVRDMRGSTTVPASGSGRSAEQGGARGAARQATEQDPEMIRLQILGDPNLRGELARSRPDLVAALEDPQRFARLFADSLDRERRERAERHRQIQLLNADPFDPEAQAKIEEIIRQERVMENLQNAMEHNPEGNSGPARHKHSSGTPC